MQIVKYIKYIKTEVRVNLNHVDFELVIKV